MEDIVCKSPRDFIKIRNTIKLMIKESRCKPFVELIGKKPEYGHVFEKLTAARQLNNKPGNNERTCKKKDTIN